MGGMTSTILAKPDNENILEQLSEIVKVPIKFIHVTRNPFDNIATIMLRETNSRDKVRKEGAEEVRKGERVKGNERERNKRRSEGKNVLPNFSVHMCSRAQVIRE